MLQRPEYQRTEPQRSEARRKVEVKRSRAEALAYMPILRTNHVVQGFIPANSRTQKKNS